MPLIHGKSKKSLQKNIATEMTAHPGEPKKNLAIAYSVQRQARKNKMAKGGIIEKPDQMLAPKVKGIGKMRGDLAESPRMVHHQPEEFGKKVEDDGKLPKFSPGYPDKMPPKIKDDEDDYKQMLAEGGNVTLEQSRMSNKIPPSYGKKPAEPMNEASDDYDRERDLEPKEEELRDIYVKDKMAYGGILKDLFGDADMMADDQHDLDYAEKHGDDDSIDESHLQDEYMAEGGMIDPMEEEPLNKSLMASDMSQEENADREMKYKTMADAIVRKRLAMGGDVDIQENQEERPLDFYKYNEEAVRRPIADDDQLMEDPMDSNEHAESLDDEDEHGMDMIDKLRQRMKMRRGF